MEENTNEENVSVNENIEKEEKAENVKLDFPAEKFLNTWIVVSIVAMATSIIYAINAFMIIVNSIIFMIANVKRLNYRIGQNITDKELKREYFSHVVVSRTAMLLILFGIASMGWGMICDATFLEFIALACVYSMLVVLPIMKSFQKRILLIKDYDYKEIIKLSNGYIIVAIFCIIFAFISREYLDEKAHNIVAAE